MAKSSRIEAFLKDVFERASKKGWTYQKEKARRKEEGEEESSGEHASDKFKVRAVLWKEGYKYAQRGHDYLEGDGGRNTVYHDFPHTAQVFDEHSCSLIYEHARFPGGPVCNFNPGAKLGGSKAGQQFPYIWEAHHMLPLSAFYLENDSGPVFSWQQYRLLLMSDYDINHGHNMIMLPKRSWAVPVHSLIQHPSDHRTYTKKVQTEMEALADDLQELIDEDKPHEDIEVAIFDDLVGLEDDFWTLLVELSRTTVAAKLAGYMNLNELVKYQAETTGTAYGWGALA